MSNEEALKLFPGDRVAFGDEGVQVRTVTKVIQQRDGTVFVYTTGGDIPHVAEAKDVN